MLVRDLASVTLELRKLVENLLPRGLRAYEDVVVGQARRHVHQRADRDVRPLAITDDRVQERAADPATEVACVGLTPDKQRRVFLA